MVALGENRTESLRQRSRKLCRYQAYWTAVCIRKFRSFASPKSISGTMFAVDVIDCVMPNISTRSVAIRIIGKCPTDFHSGAGPPSDATCTRGQISSSSRTPHAVLPSTYLTAGIIDLKSFCEYGWLVIGPLGSLADPHGLIRATNWTAFIAYRWLQSILCRLWRGIVMSIASIPTSFPSNKHVHTHHSRPEQLRCSTAFLLNELFWYKPPLRTGPRACSAN